MYVLLGWLSAGIVSIDDIKLHISLPNAEVKGTYYVVFVKDASLCEFVIVSVKHEADWAHSTTTSEYVKYKYKIEFQALIKGYILHLECDFSKY